MIIFYNYPNIISKIHLQRYRSFANAAEFHISKVSKTALLDFICNEIALQYIIYYRVKYHILFADISYIAQ